MPLDTRPSHSLTFAEACEIVMPPAARWEALKAQAGVRPGVAPELSPQEAEALQRDRYNEPGPRRLPDDGFDVERWGRAGR